MKWFFLVLLNCMSIIGLAAQQPVRLAYIEFTPIFSTSPAGKPVGILIDLADKVLTESGYQWKATSYPTNRMISQIVSGDEQLWIGLSTIPEFKDAALVGKTKIMDITLVAYTIGDKAKILKKEDLTGKSVIILRGYSYGGWADYIKSAAGKVTFSEIDDHAIGFKMLSIGRADYFLDYQGPAEKVLAGAVPDNLKKSVISSFGVYFVVSKKAPEAEKLLSDLEATFARLKKAGTIKLD